jgi:AraC family transcriptional activator of tynA and feaB
MPGLELFSTDGPEPQRRADDWNDFDSIIPSTAPADVAGCSAGVTRASPDGLWIRLFSASPGVVQHAPEPVAKAREAFFFLAIQLHGSSRHTQDGRTADLQIGDFTLLDSTRPYKTTVDAQNKVLVLGIPHPLLRRQLACPERLVALRMGYREGLNHLLADFAVGVWRRGGLSLTTAGGNLVSALLSLTAAAYSNLADAQAVGSAHLEALRLRIIHHIEKHLGDCDLSPNSIATVLATSPRYVHVIFTRGEETVSRYILRRRLEECARVLASPSQRTRSVSAIAFDHGFSSCTNFGKVFREHHGLTPTEYRRDHCPAVTGERR